MKQALAILVLLLGAGCGESASPVAAAKPTFEPTPTVTPSPRARRPCPRRTGVRGLPAQGIAVGHREDIEFYDLDGVLRGVVKVRERCRDELTDRVFSRKGQTTDHPPNIAMPKNCEFDRRLNGRALILCTEGRKYKRLPWIRATVELLSSTGERTVLVGPPTIYEETKPLGRWVYALPSPDGQTLLLQYSVECESPNAFFAPVGGGSPVSVVDGFPESTALGWTQENEAIVHFRIGVCGSGVSDPGIYLVAPGGEPELLVATKSFDVQPFGLDH